jgi:hypothetical protein
MNIQASIQVPPTTQNIQFPQVPNKIIDKSFFLEKIAPQGNGFINAETRLLALHNWAILRNTIEEGDYIRIELPSHGPNQWTKQLFHYLKILRLRPENISPTILIDASPLISQKSKNMQVIIPCTSSSFAKQSVVQHPIQTPFEVIQACPKGIKGMILSFSHFDEIDTGENFHLLPTSLKKLVCGACYKLTNKAISELQNFNNLRELIYPGQVLQEKTSTCFPPH